MASPDMPESARARPCGSCVACCIRLPIPAGEVGPSPKPPNEDCPRLSTSGCQIYARRPKLCVDFQCTWLADASWPDPWRPNRSGVMCLRETIDDDMPAAAVYEIRQGALDEPMVARIIEELKRTTAVIALIDSKQQRRCLLGHLGIPTTKATVRKPHFLAENRRKPMIIQLNRDTLDM